MKDKRRLIPQSPMSRRTEEEEKTNVNYISEVNGM